ncbi:MAG: S-methyl-5-thioribose-1-phosphate isomerase, partial [Methanofollis liminatans]|nr:S-methyl-5-thioribose-1-phosphate isomerase [Methanofollis liminatans]
MIPRTIERVDGTIRFIDQTLLPGRLEIVECTDIERLAGAIRRLEVRGAPALGIAGAYGVALAAIQ